MNGKQAKRLRRAAISVAARLVEQGRTISADQHVKPQKIQPVDPETLKPIVVQNDDKGRFSSTLPAFPKPSRTEVNKADTMRGIYRYLKKSDLK